jgi:hypothetical protein
MRRPSTVASKGAARRASAAPSVAPSLAQSAVPSRAATFQTAGAVDVVLKVNNVLLPTELDILEDEDEEPEFLDHQGAAILALMWDTERVGPDR